MYRNVGVVTLIGKEQGGTGSGKFCKGQEVRPVVLLIVAVDLLSC